MMKTITRKILISLSMVIMAAVLVSPVNAYARNICMKEHCGNTAVDCGYCRKHGPNYDPDQCAEYGCKNKKYCGSYCAAHDKCQIKSACKTANYGGRKICKQEHCGNTADSTGYCSRHSESSLSYSYSSGSTSKACLKSGCSKTRTTKGYFCSSHTCIKSGCYSQKKTGSSYCSLHAPSTSSNGNKYSSGSSSSGYDDGYESIWLDDDYDEDRYYSDSDYADGVDDAMDEFDW